MDAPAPSSPATAAAREPVDLTRLKVGDRARFLATSLPREDLEVLAALGMTQECSLRVCQVGDPWIVQVRATRIGVAASVARSILVLPEERR